jgi:hypothetical protein
MEKRYRALRIVGSLYKILGAIVLILTIISAIGVCVVGVLGGAAMNDFSREFSRGFNGMGMVGGALGGILSALAVMIGGGIGGLTLFATGEAICLLIDIEENTRLTAARSLPPNP